MSKSLDRSQRAGSDPIIIGDDNNKILISKGSDNTVKFQTQAGSSTPANSSAGAVKVYASISDMTSTSPASGDMGLVTANSSLYVFNGGGWYKLATINTSPTISSPSTGANITLATDGSATSIELVGADTDPGTILQNSYAVTTGSLTNGGGATATITSSATSDGTYSSLAPSTNTTNRFFKITPTSNTSHGGTFSLTFSMSDGISSATTVQNFTLSFAVFGSTVFDGTGDRITSPTSSDFTMGTGAFTVECWFKPSFNTTSSSARFLFDLGSNGIRITFKDSLIRFRFGTETRQTYSIGQLSTSSYQHVALVRNDSNNVKLYLNGSSVINYTTSYNHTSTNLTIADHGGTGYGFHGYISNFRIVKGTAVYTSNFTPSTSPLTAITNTKILTCFNPSGTITDASDSSHTLTVVGDVVADSSHPF